MPNFDHLIDTQSFNLMRFMCSDNKFSRPMHMEDVYIIENEAHIIHKTQNPSNLMTTNGKINKRTMISQR